MPDISVTDAAPTMAADEDHRRGVPHVFLAEDGALIGERMVRQNSSAKKWRAFKDEEKARHEHRKAEVPVDPDTEQEHHGIWVGSHGHTPGGDALDIGNKLVGRHWSKLAGEDLYRAYKNTPHAPASVFLKYLVHRYNNLDVYEDPASAARLDQSFLDLVQKGGAADKNGHLNAADLHDWTRKHAPHVFPRLLELRAQTQEMVRRGVGLGVRSINGQPHVALTRGLDSEMMNAEHPLSSHADTPNTGFGDVMHHTWVPLSDVWYSYDHGPRYPAGSLGPEDEWLVSNKGTRYQAKPEDVRASSLKEWPAEIPYIFDDARDADLANLINSTKGHHDRQRIIGRVMDHPGMGPLAADAVAKHNGPDISVHDLPAAYFAKRWVPREAVLHRINEETWIPSAFLLKNPNLTTQDLEALGPKVLHSPGPAWDRVQQAVVATWAEHPRMTSHVLERVALAAPPGPAKVVFLKSPLATPAMMDQAVEDVAAGRADDNDEVVEALAKNPHHTPEQAQRLFDWAVANPDVLGSPKMTIALGRMKLPEATVEDCFRSSGAILDPVAEGKRNIAHHYAVTNPHAASMLVSLGVKGLVKPVLLLDRLNFFHKLEPELQPLLIDRAGPSRHDMLTALAKSSGLTQWSVNALATMDPAVSVPLFHNKSVTADQFRAAYPEAYRFPTFQEYQAGGPWTESSTADAISAAFWRRKHFEDRLANEHFIKPLPANLAKSEVDMWQARAREWVADQQKAKGFYLATTHDLAQAIIRDQAIEPQFTDELLHGEAVFASRATPTFLDAWRSQPAPDRDVVVYFETPVEPEQHEDGRFFWTERAPVENARIVEVAPVEQDLAKTHAPLTFPQLGVGDDRRETKVVVTPTEAKTFWRAAANIAVRENPYGQTAARVQADPEFAQRARSDKASKYERAPVLGVTVQGIAGVGHPGHGMDPDDTGHIKNAGTGQSHISMAYTPATKPNMDQKPVERAYMGSEGALRGTVMHEDLHRIFSRVQHLHGYRARDILAQNLLDVLPPELQRSVAQHVTHRHGGPGWAPEEAITELHSYLNVPAHRDHFHRKMQHSPEEQVAFHDRMKRAYRLLQYVAPTVNHGWLSRTKPWLQKGEAEVAFHEAQGKLGISAAEAHRAYQGSQRLQKSFEGLVDANSFAFEFETNPALYQAVAERLGKAEVLTLPGEAVLRPGEESAARAFLGHNKEHERHLAAARFLSGRKSPIDYDMFRMALVVHDGDVSRAALYAVGLTDSPQNLKALAAAVKLGEWSPETSLSKNEPGSPHVESVVPGAPDANETAEEVARAVTAGLIQPLKLGGKHSKGAMAARDPKTGSVYLIKPGSGKASPAKGVRDDQSSQSAREAAAWHIMKRIGLGNFGPRADLLIVNGAPVATMKLLGAQWKSLDERNREVDGYAREVLTPYLQRGDIHRLCAFLWVIGETDAHGQNVMTHAESIALIDHGSAFAGPNFDPGHDSKSFVPYIWRVFAGAGFSKKLPEERARSLPVLDQTADAEFRKWVGSIDPALLVETMQAHGVGEVAQKAVAERLDELQTHTGPSLSRHLAELWCGVVP